MDSFSSNSFAPPKSVVADIMGAQAQGEKATRAQRLTAAVIDSLILTVPFGPSYGIAFSAMALQLRTPGAARMTAAHFWTLLAGTGGWFYAGLACAACTLTITAILVLKNGQTIAKKWQGIKVVRKDGSRATLSRIFFLRNVTSWLLTLLPGVGSLYGLVDSLFIFGDPRRCFHDYIADTIVVRA